MPLEFVHIGAEEGARPSVISIAYAVDAVAVEGVQLRRYPAY